MLDVDAFRKAVETYNLQIGYYPVVMNCNPECMKAAIEAYLAELPNKQREQKLMTALNEIMICAWSDDFKDADAKLDAIDKRAEQALKE